MTSTKGALLTVPKMDRLVSQRLPERFNGLVEQTDAVPKLFM